MRAHQDHQDEPPTLADRQLLREMLAQQMELLLGRRSPGEPVHAINPEDNKNQADQVARLMEQNTAVSLCNQTNHQLREIQAALARMSLGSYGRCAHCGNGVGKARLLARPSATLCLPCQRLADFDQWHSCSSPNEIEN